MFYKNNSTNILGTFLLKVAKRFNYLGKYIFNGRDKKTFCAQHCEEKQIK